MFFNCRIKNVGQTTADDGVVKSEDEDEEENSEDEDPAALGSQDAAGLNCLGDHVKHLWLKRKPWLDSNYALIHLTSIAIDKSIDALNNTDMFRSDWSTEGLVDEETELFGIEEVMDTR